MTHLSRAAALRLGIAAPLAALASPARAQSSTIRIGAGTDDAFMEPYWANDLGLFRRAGLDVQIVPLGPVALVAAAVGGTIEVGMADPIQIALANARGISIAYFAGGPLSTRKAATLVLCVAKNSPIRSAKDLEGKTIGIISVRSLMQITTSEWLSHNGGDPATVKFFELHFPEMAPALGRGTVDAALIGEPFLTESKADLRPIGVPFDTVAPSFTIFGWFAQRAWLDANADLARRLAAIFYETARWANVHRDESATIEAKYTRIELDVARSMARNPLSTALRVADIQPVLDIATRYKLLEPVRAADLIAPGFV
jgi:NitT/TauT family transport system substrate-binding protein